MEEGRDEGMFTYKHSQSWVPIEGRSGQIPGGHIPKDNGHHRGRFQFQCQHHKARSLGGKRQHYRRGPYHRRSLITGGFPAPQ